MSHLKSISPSVQSRGLEILRLDYIHPTSRNPERMCAPFHKSPINACNLYTYTTMSRQEVQNSEHSGTNPNISLG